MDGHGYSIDLQVEDGSIELHVLARAYRDAWLALKLRPPVGRHRLERLGLTIEFAEPGDA